MGIDGPEDISPENLMKEARDLWMTGRPHGAQVMEWVAEYLIELERERGE